MEALGNLNLNSLQIRERIGSVEVMGNISFIGKVINIRMHGKSGFAYLQDDKGVIQIYVSRDEICPREDKSLYNSFFKEKLNLGDNLEVSGYLFNTQEGVITIHVIGMELSS